MSTMVYRCTSASDSFGRESVVFHNVEVALSMLAAVEKLNLSTLDGTAAIARTTPGLMQVKGTRQVVALGRAAHTVLADFRKRTLIASDIEVSSDGPAAGQSAGDIGRFLWSCVNTSKLVAVGDSAWRSVQMLPFSEKRFFGMPPLRLSRPIDTRAGDGILVVNHDADENAARELVAMLEARHARVGYAGLPELSDAKPSTGACWADKADIHIHVGHHTMAAEAVRLVDSWHSRRLALQLVPKRKSYRSASEDVLMIEDEVNGFVCHTPEKVVGCCDELRSDRVLQSKVLDAGARTVAPLAQTWMAIAEELLAA